jgi:hypothetical protein
MANPSTAPEVVIATLLETAGLSIGGAAADIGVNLFHGVERSSESPGVPTASVWCIPTGGPAPKAYFENPAQEDYRVLTVQVVSRSAPGDTDAGLATARAAVPILHRADVSGFGYFSCTVRDEVQSLGANDHEEWRWSFNAELWYKG